MATTEERVDKLETKFSTLEQQVATVAAKVDMLVNESQQQREDIRQLNTKIDSKFDNLSNQIHNLTIAAVVGFGAISLAVGGLVVSLLK